MSDGTRIHLGIDEAGRGSVIGPLVMGAVSVTEDTLQYYATTQIADSKQLSFEKRAELFTIITETSRTHATIPLQPADIDKALVSPTTNLNMLELQAMTQLILSNPATDIFIDAISKPDYCTTNLKSLLKKESAILSVKKVDEQTLHVARMLEATKKLATITSQNKADVTFKVVSAASIIAKVTRDETIRSLEREYSLQDGILASGYPNNQLQPFLHKYKKEIKKREFPFIRYTWDWSPLKTIVSPVTLKQSKLF